MLKEYATCSNGTWTMLSDKTFASPSTAAMFCLGRAANGWTKWKDKKGILWILSIGSNWKPKYS